MAPLDVGESSITVLQGFHVSQSPRFSITSTERSLPSTIGTRTIQRSVSPWTGGRRDCWPRSTTRSGATSSHSSGRGRRRPRRAFDREQSLIACGDNEPVSGLVLERIADPEGRNGPIYANRVQALIHKMFNFALARDYGIDFNPCTGVEKPGRDRARDRVLTTQDIRSGQRSKSRVRTGQR